MKTTEILIKDENGHYQFADRSKLVLVSLLESQAKEIRHLIRLGHLPAMSIRNLMGSLNHYNKNHEQQIAVDSKYNLKNEFLECDLYECSNCCGASLVHERCQDCKENAVPACFDCEDVDICINENKETE